jgi:hypothetical protein
MSDYDKAMLDCFSRVYAASISRNGSREEAARAAKHAVEAFKSMFHRPDFRKGDY